MQRKRTISALLNPLKNEATKSNPLKKEKERNKATKRCLKVICRNCNGLPVDPKTKIAHENKQVTKKPSDLSLDLLTLSSQSANTNLQPTQKLASVDDSFIDWPIQESVSDDLFEDLPEDSLEDLTEDSDTEFTFQPRKQKSTLNRTISFNNPLNKVLDIDTEDDDIAEINTESDEDLNEFQDTFEDYSAPPFEFPSNSSNESADEQFKWIILWIMNFRIKFNLPNTATDALLKFMKLVLTEIGSAEFELFYSSLYTANKFLGISDEFVKFVVCKKCHKLYKEDTVTKFRQNNQISTMKCAHVEFLNSATKCKKICNTALSTQSKLLNGNITNRPESIFPFATIRQQLTDMYQQPGFEHNLQHWTNRSSFDNLLCDIYDRDVWKIFKEKPFDENSALFFRQEKADSHLGLVLNLDWFQPYSGVTYSIGVVYAAIANLPRDIRFKRENILILGILPGPSEPSLHKINHYLAPIVNDLDSLWRGITLNSTAECSEGRLIQTALILVSCDIPAARKICGHISALVQCHRCEKRANYVNN